MNLYRQFGKRQFDIGLSATALILLSPLLATVALAVRWRLGKPVLYWQQRPGLRGRPFWIVKFRTMTAALDQHGSPLPDAQRLTRFGRFLRSTSLDELPELWNVLCGEMSMVGPRPLLTEYLARYSPGQQRRHEVKPGLTGWAQIHGRNDISWESKFALDVWYVDHYSWLVDLTILARTPLAVFQMRGIHKQGHATTDKFMAVQERHGRQTEPTESGRNVIVLGAGGHAKVVISTLRAAGWHVAAAYDDDATKLGSSILGVEIRGTIADLLPNDTAKAVIAVGNLACRESIAKRFAFEWITVVHSAANVDSSVSLGAGTVVCAGAVIQPDCRIGRHAIICESASVSHDCVLSDFVHLAPGAHLAGGVRVGDHTLVGTGASVNPGITIGHHTLVGTGAAVVNDLPDQVVAAGCPAMVLRSVLAAEHAA